MKKSTFYTTLGVLATAGTGFFGLSAARTAQAQQETKTSVTGRDIKAEGIKKPLRCLTPTRSLDELLEQEKIVQEFMAQSSGAEQPGGVEARNPGDVTIRVWFHIVRTTEGAGDISNDKIYAQLKVLNTCFAGRDRRAIQLGAIPAEQPTANTVFRFVLAGIDRKDSTAYYNSNFGSSNFSAMCNELRKGENTNGKTGAKTLNIYFKNLSGLGVATLPYSGSNTDIRDGAYILNTTVPGGTQPGYNLGKTVVHEVGHWLGLEHTFGDETGCAGAGDFVADTPTEASPYFGGVPSSYPNTCTGANYPGRDPIENYMDYSDDDIYYQFTPGQDARMDAQVAAFRGL